MIRSNDFSKQELVSILETIDAAGACCTRDDLKAALHKAREVIGADFAVSGVCALAGGEVTGVDLAVNAGYPVEFVKLYLSEHYYRVDPVVRHLTKYSFTQSWAEIFERTADAGSAPVRSVISTALDFGLKHGISTGVYVPGREQLNVFSFAGPGTIFGGYQKKVLDVLLLHLNKAMDRVVIGPEGSKGPLKRHNRLQALD